MNALIRMEPLARGDQSASEAEALIERVTLAAMSLGIARRCLEVMLEYAKQRKTFGVPINRHGQIQRLVAELDELL